MRKGALFAVPVRGTYHLVDETIQKAVEIAVQEAEVNGMSEPGKEATPWILGRVGELRWKISSRQCVILFVSYCGFHLLRFCRAYVTPNSRVVGSLPRMQSFRPQLREIAYELPSNFDHSFSREPIRRGSCHGKALLNRQGFWYRTTDLSQYSYQPGSPSTLAIVGSAAMDITSRARKQPSTKAAHSLHSKTSGSASLSPGWGVLETSQKRGTSHPTQEVRLSGTRSGITHRHAHDRCSLIDTRDIKRLSADHCFPLLIEKTARGRRSGTM